MYLNYTRIPDRGPRILMVRLGAMGDIIHTLPAADDLRKTIPGASISWAVDSRWMPILAGNPSIDQAIPVSLQALRRSWLTRSAWGSARALTDALRVHGFDLALDFQGLIKSAMIARFSGAGLVAGFEPSLLREPPAGLLHTLRASSLSAHVVDRYRDLAAFASGRPNSGPAVFPLPPGRRRRVLPKRFVLASPQAGWGHKAWPARHYSSLAKRIWRTHGVPLVTDCAPGQEALAEEIRSAAPKGAVVLHSSTIEELIGATRAAQAVVGVDSGPMHLAAALRKRGVAIFGPTDPRRNGPYGDSIAVVRDPGASTTYKRGRDPSDSMRACSPAIVHEALTSSLA